MILREAGEQDLFWVHPNPAALVRELHSGPDVVATLRYPSAFGSLALGEAGGDRWTFTWEGIVRPRIRVRAEGAQSDLATVELPWFGWQGRSWLLRFADGRTFRWAPSGWTNLEYTLTSVDGTVLLRFKQPLLDPAWGRAGKKETHVEIAPIARSMPELPLLAVLGRYLIR